MKLITTLLFGCFYFTSPLANAQYITGPIASAMGGAGRASTDTTDGAFINPASLVHGPQAEFSALYQDGSPVKDQHRTTYGVIVMDNTPGLLFSGSFVYLKDRKTGLGQTPLDADYWSLSLAQLSIPQWSFGLSGIYLQQKEYEGENFTQQNGVVGVLYTPIPDLGIGLTYHHFLEPDEEVPLHLRLIPTLGLGFHYLMGEILRLRADFTRPEKYNDDKKMAYALGLESLFSEFFSFRMGFRWDNWADSNVLTSGITFNGPRLKLDYSIEKAVKGTGDALHSVDLRLPF